MYTFSSTVDKKIQKTDSDAIQVLNYIADNFEFEYEELPISSDLLNNPSHKELELLLAHV